MNNPTDDRAVIIPGTILGMGLGGFFDGILLHQLLQTHNMLSARYPKTSIANMEINMFWDGIFHSLTWTLTLVGVIMLWRAGARRQGAWRGRTLAGALFLGWGIFNLVEGIIDHYILDIHHVVERMGRSGFDHAFVASGIVFIVGGWLAIRGAKKRAA